MNDRNRRTDTNRILEQAHWIWPGEMEFLHNAYAQFRKDFELKRVPRSAPFCITADQAYMLYVNGSLAGRGPARGYQDHWPYDEIDIAPLLRKGHNWISILAYNAAISTYQYLHQGYAGLLAGGAWPGCTLVTGRDWLTRPCPAHARNTARLSKQLNFQEHVDARRDDRRWITHAKMPAGWKSPRLCKPFGHMPWHSVEPRGIPNLGLELLAYERTCSQAAGLCADGWEQWQNVTHGFYREHLTVAWDPAGPGRSGKGGLIVDLPPAGEARFSAVSMDLGKPGVGTFVVEVDGADGGDILDLFGCEIIDDSGCPCVPGPGQACDASLSVRLRLRKGKTRFEAFQMIGHRYLVAIARGTRSSLRLKVGLRHCVYPMDVQGRFDCGDEVFNDIHRICVQTQRVCALDAYVDTPWREQAQWWGDARVQAQNTFHLCGDARLLARGIRQIAAQEVPNGLTYGHAPTMAHHCILPDFSLIWALSIWDHYWQTGQTTLFEEQWPRIQRMLGYFETEARGDSGLAIYDPRYWLFLDWADLHKTGSPTVLNLWLLLTYRKLAELADVAGMTGEAKSLSRRGNALQKAILAELWDDKARLMSDGLDDRGRRVNVHSVHSQALTILAGLRSRDHGRMIDQRLVPFLEDRDVPGASPSSYWITYIYGVMRSAGYDRLVAEHIRAYWSPMIPYGGTFESFAHNHLEVGGETTSALGSGTCSHAWAAHPIYHLAGTLGGVTQTAPAWTRIRFGPLLALTDRVETVIPTPQGLVTSRWQRGRDAYDIELELPKGVSADVELPGRTETAAAGRSTWSVKRKD